MLKKIYQELVAIRKGLQAIRNSEKPFSEKEFRAYINRLLAEEYLHGRESIVINEERKKYGLAPVLGGDTAITRISDSNIKTGGECGVPQDPGGGAAETSGLREL